MAIQTLATNTAHFTYQYDDTVVGSAQRAAALATTCESDLSRLEDLFDAAHGFDNGNRVTVLVGNPGGGLASNQGYHSDGTTKITMVGWSAVTPASTADTGVRLEFIAEMAEVMMSLRNSRQGMTTWDPGHSDGEGLSQYLAEMFYRSGYYDAQLGHGPGRMTAWLNDASRPDWITKNETTDKNANSYGCAFLFIHFLHTQKGYPVKSIITKAGATPEATYTNLTGHAGGWNEFSSLVARFFPARDGAGQPITYAPKQCNLFPLYDDDRRDLIVVADEVGGMPTPNALDHVATVSPGILCSADTYRWGWVDPNSHLELTVSPRGFGNPVVSWTVEGVAVPAGGGTITVTADVDLDRANAPGKPTRSSQTFHLTTAISDVSTADGPASKLSLSPQEHPGTERLTLEVKGTEKYAAGVAAYSTATWTTLHTHGVEYEDRFYRDREACRERFEDFVRTHVRYRVINILLTLPDPGPDELQRPLRMLEEIVEELARLVPIDAPMAVKLGLELARVLQVSPATLGVPTLSDEPELE